MTDPDMAKEMLKTLLQTLAYIDTETLQAMVETDIQSFSNMDRGILSILDPTYYRNLMNSGEYEHCQVPIL